jgi:predicted Zn-dependent protease with MMP-like domain
VERDRGRENERHDEGSPAKVRFEELAAEALDELPDWVRQRLDNVEVIVEDLPPPGQPGLLGLYEGIPLTKRHRYSGVLPDRITLFRRTIESQAAGDEDLKRVVRHTVVHEIAHFFGISDDRLRELKQY